jgi:hypothetical protein
MPSKPKAPPRTSLSLYELDREKLDELARYLVARDFRYSLSLAFRTALAVASDSLAAAPEPDESAIAEPFTLQLSQGTDGEKARLLAIATANTEPGSAIVLPPAARRVIHAAKPNAAFVKAATELRELDGRRRRD